LQWKTDSKSYVAYRMAPTAMTLSDLSLGGHFCWLKSFQLPYIPQEITTRVSYDVFRTLTAERTWPVNSTLWRWKWRTFQGHRQSRTLYISETVQNRNVVTTDH